jgi:protein-S-isoprenylcysteine O-methyltransferase Ste14
MPPRSQRANFCVSLLFTIFGGPGFIVVYLPAVITRWRIPPSSNSLRFVACTMIVLGLLPLFESISRLVWAGRGTLAPFAPTETLVVSGLYRFVRNPMYVADLCAILGQALLFQSPGLCLYASIILLGLHLFITRYEEPTLHRKFGRTYDQFCQNVPRWIPRITPWVG